MQKASTPQFWLIGYLTNIIYKRGGHSFIKGLHIQKAKNVCNFKTGKNFTYSFGIGIHYCNVIIQFYSLLLFVKKFWVAVGGAILVSSRVPRTLSTILK